MVLSLVQGRIYGQDIPPIVWERMMDSLSNTPHVCVCACPSMQVCERMADFLRINPPVPPFTQPPPTNAAATHLTSASLPLSPPNAIPQDWLAWCCEVQTQAHAAVIISCCTAMALNAVAADADAAGVYARPDESAAGTKGRRGGMDKQQQQQQQQQQEQQQYAALAGEAQQRLPRVLSSVRSWMADTPVPLAVLQGVGGGVLMPAEASMHLLSELSDQG
eukprot:1158361-Pelagomonas_calceolata.AAC.1